VGAQMVVLASGFIQYLLRLLRRATEQALPLASRAAC
jgi:hypothetical protein